ncbi:hypothetical protein SynBIOSE41_02086 [Synechococcus sp. BIOS-E4-1]|nr:hypothetical protein SynBIOSE41_02086 [Synechococcus sp. BIOS-E4-1]
MRYISRITNLTQKLFRQIKAISSPDPIMFLTILFGLRAVASS